MKASTARMIGTIVTGRPKVYIGDSPDGEHSVEQLADMMLEKLIQVNGEAPREIMEQVRAFKSRARLLFIEYLTRAQNIERRRMMTWR